MKYFITCLEESPLCPVSYVRVVHHLQHAPEPFRFSIFVLPDDLQAARAQLPRASGVLMARTSSAEAAALAAEARTLGLPVIYDIDDYLWKLPEYVPERGLDRGVDAVLAHATLVTTPQPEIGRHIGASFPQLPVELVPNAGNIGVSGYPQRVVSAALLNSDFFRLPSMKDDFFKAIRDGAAQCNTRIVLYYFSNDAPEIATDDPHLSIIWCGIRSFGSMNELLKLFAPQIAFIPLPDDHFSRYKSVIKFAMCGAIGCAGIFSRVEPYGSFVRDGEDGWLTDNSPQSWREATVRALSLSDSELGALIRNAATRSKSEFDDGVIRTRFFELLDRAAPKDVPLDFEIVNPPPADEPFVYYESYNHLVGHWRALLWQADHHREQLAQLENRCRQLEHERDAALRRANTPWNERLLLGIKRRLARWKAALRRIQNGTAAR